MSSRYPLELLISEKSQNCYNQTIIEAAREIISADLESLELEKNIDVGIYNLEKE
jgi:hypothetical protein